MAKNQSAWWHGLFTNVSAPLLHTRLHALRHATDQVVQRLARDLPPGELEAVYQAVPGGRSWYLVHLVLDDGPEVFDRRQVRAVGWPHLLPSEVREVLLAPLLARAGGVSRGAVLLEDDLGHVRVEFDLCRRAVLTGSVQRQLQGRLENVVLVVAGGDSLAAGDHVQIRQPPEAHRAPHHDLCRMLDSFRWDDVKRAMGPNSVILAIGWVV